MAKEDQDRSGAPVYNPYPAGQQAPPQYPAPSAPAAGYPPPAQQQPYPQQGGPQGYPPPAQGQGYPPPQSTDPYAQPQPYYPNQPQQQQFNGGNPSGQPLQQITVDGRTFQGYVMSEHDNGKMHVTNYCEVLPDGSTRKVTVSKKKKDDGGMSTGQAVGLGACLACLCCCLLD
eukprot:TRINITY_DN73245_c0_g1_i1.p1 TRINITY_DN73245_c0_g1~~TRINITY_DN73245_c0_g1_i1.p1  ORF type:complete len:197 (+),score=61.57 TRINITY_DN73245_c0_g1_i1:75-593(+)